MKWISSAGGPLILVAEDQLESWGGCFGPDGLTDYDRACAVDDYVGVIEVNTGQAIVFGDLPMATAWRPFTSRIGGLFVCWFYGEDEMLVMRYLDSIPDSEFEETGLTLSVNHSPLLMFDSALDGNSIRERLNDDEIELIQLRRGNFNIATMNFRPDESTSLIIHRLLAR